MAAGGSLMSNAAKNPVTGLTAQQEEWCVKTILLGDANRAYRVAYSNTTMIQHAVRSEVSKMMKLPHIQDRLHALQAVADERLAVSVERLAKEMARIAYADWNDFFD